MPEASIASNGQLTGFLTMLSQYDPVAKLILEHGTPMTEVSPEQADWELGELGDCYMNAGRAAFDDPTLRYVEGYAVPGTVPLPMMHAWLLDPEGRIIDPTWADGVAYYGIPIPRATYSEILMRTQYWGVLGNLWLAPDLIDILRAGITEFQQ